MATNWTVTPQVGFEHVLLLQSGTPATDIGRALNPDASAAGDGRKGKMKIAFILTNSDLSSEGIEGDELINLIVDSGIAYQSPPNDVAAADSAEYYANTPLDLSTFTPIVHITPLSPQALTEPDLFFAWDSKPFIVYNQDAALVTRYPLASSAEETASVLPDSNPNPNGQLTFQLGLSNRTFAGTPGEEGYVGSFQVEIDFSHSIAS